MVTVNMSCPWASETERVREGDISRARRAGVTPEIENDRGSVYGSGWKGRGNGKYRLALMLPSVKLHTGSVIRGDGGQYLNL